MSETSWLKIADDLRLLFFFWWNKERSSLNNTVWRVDFGPFSPSLHSYCSAGLTVTIFSSHVCYFYQLCRTILSRAVTSVGCQMCSYFSPEPSAWRIWQISQPTQTRRDRPSTEVAHQDPSLEADVWTALNFHNEHEECLSQFAEDVFLLTEKAAVKQTAVGYTSVDEDERNWIARI